MHHVTSFGGGDGGGSEGGGGGGFFLAYEDFVRRLFEESIPACSFFFFFLSFFYADELARSSFKISQLRRLWTRILGQVACELVSLIGSHSRPGQQSQPTPTSLGQRCMRV